MSYTKINNTLCIGTNYVTSECRTCEQVCPQHAITNNKIDDQRCDDCGICVVECPVNGIQSLIPYQSAVEKLADQDQVVLQCEKGDHVSHFPCLGFLDGRMLLAMGQQHALIMDVEGCRHCNKVVYERLKKIIGTCNLLLQDHGTMIVDNMMLKKSVAIPVSKKVNRSAFFKYLMRSAVVAVGNLVAETTETYQRYEPAHYIKKQLGPVASSHVAETLFFSLVMGDGCNACGLCAKICPRKAIHIEVQKDVIMVDYDPIDCYNCGLCIENCPQAALSIVKDCSWHATLYKIKLPLCQFCHQVFQPIGDSSLCWDCVKGERSKKYL